MGCAASLLPASRSSRSHLPGTDRVKRPGAPRRRADTTLQVRVGRYVGGAHSAAGGDTVRRGDAASRSRQRPLVLWLARVALTVHRRERPPNQEPPAAPARTPPAATATICRRGRWRIGWWELSFTGPLAGRPPLSLGPRGRRSRRTALGLVVVPTLCRHESFDRRGFVPYPSADLDERQQHPFRTPPRNDRGGSNCKLLGYLFGCEKSCGHPIPPGAFPCACGECRACCVVFAILEVTGQV